MARILLIEDNINIAELIKEHVAHHCHFPTDWVSNLSDARINLTNHQYDVVLLDIMLSDGSGFDFISHIKKSQDTKIIIITARDKVSDKIRGLDLGADDYLIKPFDFKELIARIKAVLRRNTQNTPQILEFFDCIFSLEEKTAHDANGKLIALTAKEWVILDLFLHNPNKTITRSMIENALYDMDSFIESNVIDVLISRIRKKIHKNSIKTIRGIGFRWGGGANAEYKQ